MSLEMTPIVLTGKTYLRFQLLQNGQISDFYREIQVEFEARTPEERDLPGIISLLRQCFRGSDEVDLSVLAKFIMKQRSVGSVVTQSPSDSTDDEDDYQFGRG